MLIEFIAENSVEICNEFGFPPYLMGLRDSTYNSGANANKGLYQDTIIPEADSVYEEWNTFFRTADWGDVITKDYNHLPILQEDKEMMGRAMLYQTQGLHQQWTDNMITANQYLDALGYDTVTGFDVYYTDWVKMGKAFGGSGAAAPPLIIPPTNGVQTTVNANGN